MLGHLNFMVSLTYDIS